MILTVVTNLCFVTLIYCAMDIMTFKRNLNYVMDNLHLKL